MLGQVGCHTSLRDFERVKREILDRIGIQELASEQVALKRSGRRWVGLCPFHPEKTPSFTVSPERASFKCFGCGKGGDIFSFVQFRENVDFGDALRMLADRAGVDLDETGERDASEPGRADLARVNDWAMRFFRARLLDESVGKVTREYLRARQISDETAERFGLGLAAEGGESLRQAAARAGIQLPLLLAADLIRSSDRGDYYDTFRNRLMFPIRDTTNRVVGFGGRTLADDRAKYLNTRQNALFDKGRGLYGIDLARDSIGKRGRAVLVEGYTDCLAAHQAGFTEVVATLGTALTEAQVDLLRRYCEQIVLLFDSDKAGEAAAERAIRVAFPRCVGIKLARIPDGKDPSEFLGRFGADKFSDLLNDAVDALEFRWLQTRERFRADASSAKQREAVLDFMRVVAEAAQTTAVDAIQRGLMVNQVAHLIQMDRSEVSRLMFRVQPKPRGGSTQPGVQQREEQHSIPLDTAQAAWGHLLEVALNEPSLLSKAERLPEVSKIADRLDRRIASVLWELAGQSSEFGLADVSARFHESELVERLMELARRGARRANYEQTFRLALERILRAGRDEELECHKRECFQVVGEQHDTSPSPESTAALSEGVRQHRSYVPRRLIRGTSAPQR